jgi:hypothetical protein
MAVAWQYVCPINRDTKLFQDTFDDTGKFLSPPDIKKATMGIAAFLSHA